MSNFYHFKMAVFQLAVMILATFTGTAQEPGSLNIKDKVAALRAEGGALIKKQEYDQAIPLLLNGLALSQKASLDSFTACNYYLLGLSYRYKNKYDSALYYLGRSAKISDPKGYTILQASVQIEYYAIFNRTGRTDSATAAINRMKTLLPQLDSNSVESAKIEMYLGHDDKHKTKYTEAMGHYYKALHTFTNQKDSVDMGNIYISLANVLTNLAKKDKALDYHQQAATLFTRMGRRFELANELLNIADLYLTSGSLDSAEVSARKALLISEALNDKTYQAYAYMNLGNIYKRRKKFPEAEEYFSLSIRMTEAAGNYKSLLVTYQSLGEMYMSEKQPAKAKPYLEKHLQLAREMKSREDIVAAYWDMGENEAALHNYAKAYEYQKLFSIYQDSATTQSSLRASAEMEAKYEAKKKEEEILLLKKDQQLAKLNLQRQKNIEAAGISFLLLLLLIGFLVINRYRILHRAKNLIEMERMRNSIARDLHDDIGSTLTSINILSKVSLREHTNGETPMSVNMQKIKDRTSEIMESMGDIVWTINPQNDSVEQMIVRMKEFTAEILDPLNINYTFKEGSDFSTMKLDIRKRKDFYLLFKEAVNNAAKYSHCQNLVIELQQDQHQLHLKIADDGTGFNEQEIRNGNGLRNMRGRAASMQAGIRIDTAKGRGTSIAVNVAVT